MKVILLFSILMLFSSPAFSQNDVGVFTVLLGGSVGKIEMDGSDFGAFYKDQQLVYTGLAGLGNGETFVIAKYRVFKATGQSKLTNSDATGFADWQQRILLAGFRVHPSGSVIYFDATYVFNHAEESIGTQNPVVDVLTASQKMDDNGFAFALGLAPRLAGPLALTFDVEYSFMLRKSSNDSGRRVPNLGGFYYGGGLSFYFNN